ncbi:MAG: 2-dehydropantoate 2-reductase [Synergistales bacterium]|nr:2-dehydropantoate 2-reductase [Synergistales bacterium]
MIVTVVGFGALGGHLAALLDRSGRETTLQALQHPGEHLEVCMQRGLRWENSAGEEHTLHIPMATEPEALEPADLVLVVVKAYSTADVAPLIPSLLKPDGVALSLQNGLGNGAILARTCPLDRLALGTCTWGAFKPTPGAVRGGTEGAIRLGPYDGRSDLRWVANALDIRGLNASHLDEPFGALWEKVIANTAINPVTALVRRPNGVLLEHEPSRELVRRLCAEAVAVARAEGYPFDTDTQQQRVVAVLEGTRGNRSSMLQDVEQMRPTEAQAITGAVLERGSAHGLTLPTLATVHRLIETIDASLG